MSINYDGYPYYSEEEVKKRENIARKTGYKEGYTQALRDRAENLKNQPCSYGAPAEREDTEVDVSYLTRKLIKRLDEICVMELPEDWLTGHPEQFRLRVLAGVKDAACLVAAALRVMEEGKKHE